MYNIIENMKLYNNEKVIVSLTSHGERLMTSAATSIFSILKGNEKFSSTAY